MEWFTQQQNNLFILAENCPGQMVEIAGRAGLFLTGQVSPMLEGVEISIKKSGATTTLIMVLTDESGTYRCLVHFFLSYSNRQKWEKLRNTILTQKHFVLKWLFVDGFCKEIAEKWFWNPFFSFFLTSVGPLHSDSQYEISASKEGFVLTPVEGKTGDFKAFALAGVTFEVRRHLGG